MKKILILLFVGGSVKAQTLKDQRNSLPQWSVSVQIDHISFPSFGKFRPSGRKGGHYLKSWSIMAGKVISYPNDNRGLFHVASAGVVKNARLQKGVKIGLQSGYTTEGRSVKAPLFQTGIDAGALLLIQRSRIIGSELRNMYPAIRLQWAGGVFANGGVAVKNVRYTAGSVSYKLWMQGPYIRKHAAALPHQSLGFTSLF